MRTKVWTASALAVVMSLSMLVAACAPAAPVQTPQQPVAQQSATTAAQPGAQPAQPGVEPAPTAAAPKSGGELRIGWEVNFATLDHRRTPSNSVRDAVNYIHETLFMIQDGELVPWLVEDYQFSADGRTLTLRLREGIVFHDGTPFDAAAVKYNLDWFRSPQEGWQFRHLAADISEVLTPDAYTVEIHMEKPNMFLREVLALQSFAIVSPAADQANPGDYSRNVAGTGPFKLSSWTPERLVLDRNPDYWGPTVYLDRITFRVIPDSSARAIALEAGDVDVARVIPYNDVERLQAMPDVEVLVVDGYRSTMLFMNNRRPPFDNPKVRQAMILATNRDLYSQTIFSGLARNATNIYGPGLPDRIDLGIRPYDPERAKQLLAEAGYADGFDLEIATAPSWELDVVAQAVAADLQRVGIRVSIQSMEFNSLITYFQRPDSPFQMVTMVMQPLIPTAWNILSDHRSGVGRNAVGYANPEIDRLVAESAATVDPDKRRELLAEGQRLLWQEVARGALVHLPVTTAYRPHVKNLIHTEFDALRAQWSWLDR